MENVEQAQVVGQNIGGQEAGQPAQPELNITDLQNLRAIIDTAARRGAFGAQEMSGVGSVFDRLNAFLTAVAPATAPATAGAPAETPTAE